MIPIDWNPILVVLAPSVAALIASISAYIQTKINHKVIQDVKTQTNGQMLHLQDQVNTLADNQSSVKVDTP